LPHSKSAVLKAISIDKNLAEAHIALAGLYYDIEYNREKAEQEYKIAIQLARNNPAGYTGYASFLASMGKFAEGVRAVGKAEEISETISTDITYARIYYSMRNYDKAAEYCKKSLQKGENVLGHFYLGFVFTAQKKFDEAILEFRKAANFSKDGGALAGLAYGYAMGGKREEALKIINELKTTDGGTRLVPYRIAAVYVALNEPNEAIEWLEKDYCVKGNWMNQLKVDPVMNPLRNHPEFIKLLQRMKFPAS
jgi:tetratricopeptide (TPR) repeat protein